MTPTPTAAVRGSDTATVQATGHGAPPACPGTVLVLTGHVDTVIVDPAARTAARRTVPAGGATCA